MQNNYFWIVTTLIALVVGVGGYAVLAERGVVPAIPALTRTQPASTEDTSLETVDDTTPPADQTPPTTTTSQPSKNYLDIKDVYDTVVAPPIRSDEPRSGTKEVTVRGKLHVIKVDALCEAQAGVKCPEPNSSDFRFELLDTYEPTKYRLGIRKTGDPVVKDLTDGQVYIVTGILNYSFSDSGKATFSFDPTAVK